MAGLILLFGVVVPIGKGTLMLLILIWKRVPFRRPLYRFVNVIGKWSMADVSVMGIFLAYLATESTKEIMAQLHEGFYFFLGYCLISILSVQVAKVRDP